MTITTTEVCTREERRITFDCAAFIFIAGRLIRIPGKKF